jgi:four helix bundle protein
VAKIEHFEDLKIWKDAAAISVSIIKISMTGPLSKDFGIRDQIRRSALSISSNIAEGFEYNNNKEFIRFLKYSKGSAGELRSQLYIAFSAELIEREIYEAYKKELLEMSRQISGFIKYLQEHKYTTTKTREK